MLPTTRYSFVPCNWAKRIAKCVSAGDPLKLVFLGASSSSSGFNRGSHMQPIRQLLTHLGTLAAHPLAFVIVAVYAVLWALFQPGGLDWHSILWALFQPGGLDWHSIATVGSPYRE